MKKNKCIVLCLMAVVLLGAPLFGQTGESLVDKVSFELEFNASVLSVDSDGVVDSLTDAGFNEDGTKISLNYEDELWGGSVSLKFRNEGLRILSSEIGERFNPIPLALDELYGWVKPFGPHFKFTGGIFENTDGIAEYTDDIDLYGIGPFFYGEKGSDLYAEPDVYNNPALANGFLTDVIFGPVILQLLLAPNYSKESASELASGLFTQMFQTPTSIDVQERFFRIGGWVIVDIGVGTIAAHFKTFQWPIAIVNPMEAAGGNPNAPYPGSKLNWNSFGVYFDFTAVENLGVSLGYTGFLPSMNDSDYDNVLFSGIDLRATWTGIPGLSLSTHNNISFAKGAKNHWMRLLVGDDTSFLTFYNVIGMTKELSDRFSINAVISNLYSKSESGAIGAYDTDIFSASAKFIAAVGEHAEFNVGVSMDVTKIVSSGAYFGEANDTLTAFSIPVGVKVNF